MKILLKTLTGILLIFSTLKGEAQVVYRNPAYSDAYLSGKLNIRVKEKYRNQVNGNSIQHPAFEQWLVSNQATLIKRFPLAKKPAQDKNEQGERLADLSLFFSIKLPSDSDPVQFIPSLSKTGIAEIIEPHFLPELLYVPSDDSIGAQYGLQKIAAFAAWDIHQGDTNMVIGITDTGIDPNHPDITDNIARNWNDPVNGTDDDNDGFTDNFIGWDTGNDDNDPTSDGNFHGQHVTGLASATADNGIGMAGSGFKCRFIHVKIANSGGSLSGAYEGLVYAADHGCRIINCSWGGTQYSALNAEIVRYASINQNCMVICGAGNNSNSTSFYPAAYDYAVAVGSTDASDFKSDFSNFGYFIDVFAPGDFVLSTWANGGYLRSGGTSMASPLVAGCAAIIQSAFPNLNSRQITEKLKISADSIDHLPFNAPWQEMLGDGRVNLFKALTESGAPAPVMHEIQITDSGNGQFLPGDTIDISGLITNYLYPASSVNLQISSVDGFLNPLQGALSLGSLNTLENFIVDPGTLLFQIDPNCPMNQQAVLKLTFNSDGNIRNQYLSISVHADFVNITHNAISTSVGSNSLAAISGNGFLSGLGFQYNGNKDLLYECGLMIGLNETTVADRIRGTGGSNDDFSILERITRIPPYEGNTAQYAGSFHSTLSNLPIRVAQRVIADSSALNQKFIILEYTIENDGGQQLDNLATGLFTDYDLINAGMNGCGFYADVKTGYVFTLPNDTLYAGVSLLANEPAIFHAIDNVPGGSGGLNLYDGYSESEKNQSLRTERLNTAAGMNGTDVISVVSAPAFSLLPGQTKRIAFALVVGNSASDLYAQADEAKVFYDTQGLPLNTQNKPATINIFPNPAFDELKLQNLTGENIGELRVIGLEGKVLKTLSNQKENTVIQLNDLPAGYFILEIQNGNQTQHLPFLHLVP